MEWAQHASEKLLEFERLHDSRDSLTNTHTNAQTETGVHRSTSLQSDDVEDALASICTKSTNFTGQNYNNSGSRVRPTTTTAIASTVD